MTDNDRYSFTFFFGLVPQEHLKDFPEEEYFYDEDGNAFYFKIEMDEEMFYIHDTCERMIPVDREAIRSMGTALFGVEQIYNACSEAEALFNKRVDAARQLVEHFHKQDMAL